MRRFHRRVSRLLPWAIAGGFVIGASIRLAPRADRWLSLPSFLFTPIALVVANGWLWLAPMRGTHRWTWLPWLALALAGGACLAWATDTEFPPLRLVDLWWPDLALLAALPTFAGALRRASETRHERSLGEVALRVAVASGTLLLVARLTDMDAAGRWVHGGSALADIAPRSVIHSAGHRLACHWFVAVLAPAVYLVHRDRPRARAVLLPSVGLAILGVSLFLLDLVELDAARRLWPAPLGADDVAWLENTAWVSTILGSAALLVTIAMWTLGASLRAVAPRSALRVGWASASAPLLVALLSTSAFFSPPSDGPSQSPASLESVGADENFVPLVGTRHEHGGEVVAYDGIAGGIGVLTAGGELRSAPARLARPWVPIADFGYRGRPYDRPVAEIVVDQRVTLGQVVTAAQQLRAFDRMMIAWRVRADIVPARAARERWGFVERSSRALAGRSIEFVEHAEGCAASESLRGALHTRCARHDGIQEEILVLRGGDLTVGAWLASRTEADRWIAIEVDRRGVIALRSDELVWPHDPPERTHQLAPGWPWVTISAVLLALVLAMLLRARRVAGTGIPDWVQQTLGMSIVARARAIGPYRTFNAQRPESPDCGRTVIGSVARTVFHQAVVIILAASVAFLMVAAWGDG